MESEVNNMYLTTTIAPKKDLLSEKSENDGWRIIPSKISSLDDFKTNLGILKKYSIPNGWCTGKGYEETYLPQGDFHLFIKNGRAKVAIRMMGNRIAEIQGPYNARPFEWWEEIMKYVNKNGLGQDSEHYKEIEEAAKINSQINTDEEYRKEFVNKIVNNPKNWEMLSKKNRKITGAKENAIMGWRKLVKEKPSYLKNCPFKEVKNDYQLWEDIIKHNPYYWKECPFEDIKNNSVIKQMCVDYWRKNILEKPIFMEHCPFEEIKTDAKLWKEIIRKNPDYFEKCPEVVKQQLEKV